MKKNVLFLLFVFLSGFSFAQLTGTKTIPGDYASIAAAITALNAGGVGSGGVTFNITPGHTETFATVTSGLITATGTSANPIVFKKNGAGANPLVTAATPGTGTYDYIFCIGGGDYITFDGISIQENAANLTATTQMEYGFAILKASATNGSQNNTIKNGTISLSGNTGGYGIYSNNWAYTAPGTLLTVTSAAGANSFNKFFSLTFNTCYNGIYLYGYAASSPYDLYDTGNQVGKDGANTFNGLGNGGTTLSCYGMYVSYQSDIQLANNTFTGTVPLTSGSCYTFYILTGSNANVDVFGNTVSITYNGTGSFYGIYNSGMGSSGTTNSVNYYNNSIVSNSLPNFTSGTIYFIYISTGGVTANFYGNTVSNNTVGSATATATGTIYYTYFSSSPTTAGTTNMYNNTVSNNTRTQSVLAGGSTYILYNGGTGNVFNEYGNTVNNITVGTNGTTYGLYNLFSGTTKNVYNNTVTNVLNANSVFYALYNGNGSGNAYFYNNKLQNINMASGTGSLYGIYQSSGTNVYYYNNFISELKAPTAATTIYGAYISGGTSVGAYNNTIFLNAVSTGANFSVTGVYASVTPGVDLRNNIVVNTSTPMGTGRSIAYQRSGTSLTTYTASSNTNDFWAGTPGANNLIFYDGTNSDQTLAAFKSRVSPRDAGSVTEIPPFVNVTSAPYDLHLQTTIPTQCESGGQVVSSPVAIVQDYDANPRFPNSGYPNNVTTPATAPDMGADEFGGLILDLIPPSIVYTPFLNTSSLTARTLTATITDASGVPTSGTGLPQLYWKSNAGAYSNVQGVFIGSSQYTFTFGAGVVLGDVISYYIVAQDGYSTPNVGSAPAAGASGFTASPPAAATPTTTPSLYTIVGTICGTFHVGAGKTYATFTSAINDFNNKEMSCAVTFLLDDAAYPSETFPIVINANGGASAINTLTIKPNTGVSTTLTGAVNASPLIKVLNNYTTIDGSNAVGGTTRNLTISNTSVTTPNVLVLGSSGAASLLNCTIKNTIMINGINSSSAVLISDGATPGSAGNFNNIVIQNNSIQLAFIGLYCIANPSAGNGSGLQITGNDFNTSGANAIRLVGVYVQGVDGSVISNNNIGNIANTADASNITAIWCATGTVNTTISGNTIATISGTSSAPRGIALSSGALNSNNVIRGNTISGISTSSGSSSIIPTGIYVFSVSSGITVSNNLITNIKYTGSSGYGARGLDIATGVTSSSMIVANNVISDVLGDGDATPESYGIAGIMIRGATGGIDVYHNSVNLYGTITVGTFVPKTFAFYSGGSVVGLNLVDNMFVNSIDKPSTATAKAYAIYNAGAASAYTSINYNDYFTSGAQGALGFLVSDVTSLAAWKTATAQDVNSINADPAFTGPSNLLPANLAIGKLGSYLATVTTDYTNANRTNPPDIGAYEFGTAPTVITLAATVLTNSGATLNGSINANTLTTNSFFDYGLTTAYGTSTAGVPVSVSGSTTTGISLPVTGLAPLTTYHFRARGVTAGGMIVYGNDMTFTTTAPPPIVVTIAATSITSSGATVNGTVNANNLSTAISFEYGQTIAYGSTTPGVPATVTGASVTPVNAVLTGLLPNTLYHFRAVGTSAAGTTNGNDLTFTTGPAAPTVVTNPASNITTTGGQLNGTVTANAPSATVSFEWGLTTAYGSTAAGTPSTVNGNIATASIATLTALVTNTTYHYRCVAVNSVGTFYGLDQSFLTGCPAPAPAGTITGPIAVCANSTGNIYSVGTIVNAVSYAWTLPAGAVITAGSGTNSITVTFGAVAGNVTVAGVGTCGNGTPSTLAVVVNALPAPTIAGPASACVNVTGNVYTTQTGMTGYSWTVSAGGTITAGTGTNAITVTWSTTGAKTVTVNYINASNCTAATPASYAVTVNALPTPTITGTSNVCQGASGVVYTTQTGMTNYLWTVSAGGTITSGGTPTSNTVTVTWTTSGAKTVTVNYTNASGCIASTATTFNVTVNPTPVPTIGSTNNPCIGSTNNVYYTESGMTGYVWTVSTGGTIVSGQGTSTLNVTWNLQGSQTVTVNYANPGGCSSATPGVYTVFVNSPPNAAGPVSGTTSVCAGANGVVYSTTPVVGALSYSWSVPAGATIASGAGSTSITVNFGPSAVTGSVSVAAANDCGNGPASTLAVTVNPLPASAGTITGPASVCAGSAGMAYSVPVIPNATSYAWTVPAGATITSGSTTRNIVVTFGSSAGAGVITAKGINSCGTGAVSPNFNVTINAVPETPVITVSGNVLTSSAPAGNQWFYEATAIPGANGQSYTVTSNTGYYWCVVTLNGCPSPISNKVWVVITGQAELQISNVSIYPVPNDGRFVISINNGRQETFSIRIYSQVGALISDLGSVLVNGIFEKQVDLRPLATGVYSVVIFNNEQKVVKKLIINK